MGKLVSLVVSLGFGALLLTCAEPVTDSHTPAATATEKTPTVTSIAANVLKATDSLDERESELSPEVSTVHPEMVECYRNLDDAIQQLSKVNSYTARWVRQIRLYGSLRDEEHVDLKIRHQPFSVHMNWRDGSQQALFCEGKYDGKLLAHKSRGFASLRPIWRLQPESRLALKNSRYPITQLGMLRLAERLKKIVCEVPRDAKVDVEITPSEYQGRPSIRQYVRFGSPAAQPVYSESELYIDEQTMALVSITNHGWINDGTDSELIEHYRFEQIDWDAQLTDNDFDEKNEAYPFTH